MEFIDLSRQRLIKRLSYLTKLHLKAGWISFLQLIQELNSSYIRCCNRNTSSIAHTTYEDSSLLCIRFTKLWLNQETSFLTFPACF